MYTVCRKSSKSQKGSLLIEFSLVGSVLLLLLFGVADFGRLFYASLEVANAATAGAHYGAFNSGGTGTSNSSDTQGIINAAKNESPELSGLTVTPSTVCQDSNGNSADCGASGAYKYVQVTTSYTFQTLFNYPQLPSSVNLSKTVMMRYQ